MIGLMSHTQGAQPSLPDRIYMPIAKKLPYTKHHRLAAVILLIGLFVCHSARSEDQPWHFTTPTVADDCSQQSPEGAPCGCGELQSPINIKHSLRAHLPELDTRYSPGPATVKHIGHTLEVRTEMKGLITLGTKSYDFEQLHFHQPGVDLIKGRSYPLVAHLVHRSSTGEVAVVAIVFKRGQENANLAQLLAVMPRHKGDAFVLGKFDIAQLLPQQREYYAYKESMSAQPDIEGINWHILKTPMEVSDAQLHAFQLILPAHRRPAHPARNRAVRVGG